MLVEEEEKIDAGGETYEELRVNQTVKEIEKEWKYI